MSSRLALTLPSPASGRGETKARGGFGQASFFSQRSSFDQSSWCERTTSEL